MEHDTMTVEEAAAYLRVDPVTVQRELRKGRLPGNQVGRAWRLSRQALQDYVRGGDPTLAMIEAGGRFHRGDLDGGLRVLLRHFVADARLKPSPRLDMLKKLSILADAAEGKGNPKLARKAKYNPEEPSVIEERSGGGSIHSVVNMNGLWNRTVEDFARALEELSREKKGRKT